RRVALDDSARELALDANDGEGVAEEVVQVPREAQSLVRDGQPGHLLARFPQRLRGLRQTGVPEDEEADGDGSDHIARRLRGDGSVADVDADPAERGHADAEHRATTRHT